MRVYKHLQDCIHAKSPKRTCECTAQPPSHLQQLACEWRHLRQLLLGHVFCSVLCGAVKGEGLWVPVREHRDQRQLLGNVVVPIRGITRKPWHGGSGFRDACVQGNGSFSISVDVVQSVDAAQQPWVSALAGGLPAWCVLGCELCAICGAEIEGVAWGLLCWPALGPR